MPCWACSRHYQTTPHAWSNRCRLYCSMRAWLQALCLTFCLWTPCRYSHEQSVQGTQVKWQYQYSYMHEYQVWTKMRQWGLTGSRSGASQHAQHAGLGRTGYLKDTRHNLNTMPHHQSGKSCYCDDVVAAHSKKKEKRLLCKLQPATETDYLYPPNI